MFTKKSIFRVFSFALALTLALSAAGSVPASAATPAPIEAAEAIEAPALQPSNVLANQSAAPQGSGTPALPPNLLVVADGYTCALRSDGNIVCWGRNLLNQATVSALPAGLRYTRVDANDHTCGLRSDGSLVCWGYQGANGRTNVPALPAGLSYTQVGTGADHTCALRSDGSIVCWGSNIYGETTVPSLSSGVIYTQVSSSGENNCGLHSDGSLVCWGRDNYGSNSVNAVPALPAGVGYSQVSVSGMDTCALRTDGNMVCWGNNDYGQTNIPALPAGLSYTQAIAGGPYSCGLRSDGSLVCWGQNVYGEITVPALPAGLSYTQVSAGGMYHTCALRSDGSLVCWGAGTTNTGTGYEFGQSIVPSLPANVVYGVGSSLTVQTIIDNNTVFPNNVSEVAIAIGDLTNDGLQDIAITKGAEDNLAGAAVFQGSGSAWDSGALLAGTSLNNAAKPIIAPIRNDGKNWLVFSEHVAGNGGEYLRGFRYAGTSLAENKDITAELGSPGWFAPGVADLNNDGSLEIWFVSLYGSANHLLRYVWNSGTSSYTGVQIAAGSVNGEPLLRPMAGDFKGNGTQSLVWLEDYKKMDLVTYTPGFGVANHTNGTIFSSSDGITAYGAGNIDNQTGTDIAIATWSGTSSTVRLISGGTFTSTTVATGITEYLRSVQVGDLDGDGTAEIYAAGDNGGVFGYDPVNGWRLLETQSGIQWRDGASSRWSGESKDTVLFVGMAGGKAFRVISITSDIAPTTYAISGNAGIAGATLSYTDGSAKTVTADGNGNYSFVVSYNWSGTVTPSKTGYTFTPASKTYANVVANQTAQNYTATLITYTISGNAGIAGTTLSYTDGTVKTATADGSGNYSFTVSYNWSGAVTPSKTGYTFTPASRTYANVVANQTAQDYTATAITYTISGNAGVGGATLSYTDGSAKTATADGSGNYSFTVSYNWSGTVLPSMTGYVFTPASKTYANIVANQTAQNYTATLVTYTISGNAGVTGATLSYTDGAVKTTTADGSGNYSFTVSYNWSGTVTPSKTGYTFTPDSRSYVNVLGDQTTQDYTATLIMYTISGNAGVAGTTLSYTDGLAKTVTVDSHGNYSFTVSYNWSGTVTPSKPGHGFLPATRMYANVTADQFAQDYDIYAPAGAVADTTPTYTWNKVTGAAKYEYQVMKGTSTVYTKAVGPAACGSITCSNTPSTVLGLGTFKWRVRANVAGKWQAYSAFKSFTIKPKAGRWECVTGCKNRTDLVFYITPNQAGVDKFSVVFYSNSCGNKGFATTPHPLVPIKNNSFSFSGSFYVNNVTFVSPTRIKGSTGVTNYSFPGCPNQTLGPYTWEAAWKNVTQPLAEGLGMEENPLELLSTGLGFDSIFTPAPAP